LLLIFPNILKILVLTLGQQDEESTPRAPGALGSAQRSRPGAALGEGVCSFRHFANNLERWLRVGTSGNSSEPGRAVRIHRKVPRPVFSLLPHGCAPAGSAEQKPGAKGTRGRGKRLRSRRCSPGDGRGGEDAGLPRPCSLCTTLSCDTAVFNTSGPPDPFPALIAPKLLWGETASKYPRPPRRGRGPPLQPPQPQTSRSDGRSPKAGAKLSPVAHAIFFLQRLLRKALNLRASAEKKRRSSARSHLLPQM